LPSAAGDSFSVDPKIYVLKLYSVYKIRWHPDNFVSWDSIIGLRADAAPALSVSEGVPCFLLVT
jgi:hypothetical protein